MFELYSLTLEAAVSTSEAPTIVLVAFTLPIVDVILVTLAPTT